MIMFLLLMQENIFRTSRHTFVTIQLSNNIPVSTVAALVGDTPATIYKVYAHSFQSDEVQASHLMDELVNLPTFSASDDFENW